MSRARAWKNTCSLVLAVMALFLAQAARDPNVPLPMAFHFWGRDWLYYSAFAFLVMSALNYRLPTRISVFGSVLLMSGCLLPLAYFAWLAPEAMWACVTRDETLGWRGLPHSTVHHRRRPDFDVYYKLDEEGWRATPVPATSVGQIYFLGCSYTFGTGVEDDETFVNRLARSHWSGRRIRNWAYPGWGTAHAHLLAERILRETPAPTAIVYGWIRHHAQRNGHRKSWQSRGGRQGVGFPSFRLRDGQLIFEGILPADAAVDRDDEATETAETELSIALLRDMETRCRFHHVPFVVLAFAQKDDADSLDPVIEVVKGDMLVIDLRGLDGPYFQRDPHPTAAWHAKVADEIARRWTP